jgi:hypothetical protein
MVTNSPYYLKPKRLSIELTFNSSPAFIERMRVDQSGLHLSVSQ